MGKVWQRLSKKLRKKSLEAHIEPSTNKQTLSLNAEPTNNRSNVLDTASTVQQDQQDPSSHHKDTDLDNNNSTPIVDNFVCIECGAVSDISTVAQLYEQAKEGMGKSQTLVFDTHQVECVDAATLQMFAALFHSASEKGISVKWKNPCDAIQQSATLLGLQEHLCLTVDEARG